MIMKVAQVLKPQIQRPATTHAPPPTSPKTTNKPKEKRPKHTVKSDSTSKVKLEARPELATSLGPEGSSEQEGDGDDDDDDEDDDGDEDEGDGDEDDDQPLAILKTASTSKSSASAPKDTHVPLPPDLQRAQTLPRTQPPTGYSPLSHPPPSSLFSKFSLSNKQIWHITAPASFTLQTITSVALASFHNGIPAITHEGTQFAFVAQDPEAGATELLIPGGEGYQLLQGAKEGKPFDFSLRLQQLVNLPELTASTAVEKEPVSGGHESESESEEGLTGRRKRPARPQPEGLRMRFQPFGTKNVEESTSPESGLMVPKESLTFRVPVGGNGGAMSPVSRHRRKKERGKESNQIQEADENELVRADIEEREARDKENKKKKTTQKTQRTQGNKKDAEISRPKKRKRGAEEPHEVKVTYSEVTDGIEIEMSGGLGKTPLGDVQATAGDAQTEDPPRLKDNGASETATHNAPESINGAVHQPTIKGDHNREIDTPKKMKKPRKDRKENKQIQHNSEILGTPISETVTTNGLTNNCLPTIPVREEPAHRTQSSPQRASANKKEERNKGHNHGSPDRSKGNAETRLKETKEKKVKKQHKRRGGETIA